MSDMVPTVGVVKLCLCQISRDSTRKWFFFSLQMLMLLLSITSRKCISCTTDSEVVTKWGQSIAWLSILKNKKLNQKKIKEFAVAYPTERLFVHCFQIKLEFGVLVFVEWGKPENPEKNTRNKDENQQQTQPRYQTRATLVGGEHSHHCVILPPQYHTVLIFYNWPYHYQAMWICTGCQRTENGFQ